MVNQIRRRVRHLSEKDADRQVTVWQESGATISDACAVTVASWWQSPGRIGHVLAGFASGTEVDREELRDDIERSIQETARPVRELDALLAWLEVQP